MEATNEAGFMTHPARTLMHRLPIFADCPKMDISVVEDLEKRIINIPSSASLCGEVKVHDNS
jgi:perosamine synthetase